MVHNIPCTISFFLERIHIYIYIISLAIENEPWMILKTLFMNHEPLVDAEISDFRGKVADSNSRAARAAGSCRDVTTDRQVSPGWRTQMELGKAEDCVSHTLFSLDYIYIYILYIYIYTVYIYIYVIVQIYSWFKILPIFTLLFSKFFYGTQIGDLGFPKSSPTLDG